jgi:LPXTG-motif cell wall-anchored protein
MSSLTTEQMIGIGVGGVVLLAGIGGVVYKKKMDREKKK